MIEQNKGIYITLHVMGLLSIMGVRRYVTKAMFIYKKNSSNQ